MYTLNNLPPTQPDPSARVAQEPVSETRVATVAPGAATATLLAPVEKKPFYCTRTFWVSVAGVFASVAALLQSFNPQWALKLAAVGILCGNLGSLFSRFNSDNVTMDAAEFTPANTSINELIAADQQ